MHNSVRPKSETKLKQLSEKLQRNELQMSEVVKKIEHNYGKLESFMGCSIDHDPFLLIGDEGAKIYDDPFLLMGD